MALAAWNWPTAQPSAGVGMDTLAKVLSVTWCGCGFTLGATCQMLPAAAPALPAAATASRLAATPMPRNRAITNFSSVVVTRTSRPGHHLETAEISLGFSASPGGRPPGTPRCPKGPRDSVTGTLGQVGGRRPG